MKTVLRVDSSARFGESGTQPHGSHTRRLTQHFLEQWLACQPDTRVITRDVAAMPPTPVDARWIEAAFTKPNTRSGSMKENLLESDRLVDEVQAANLILIGAPMYNFGVPSPLKAWIDNVVRVGRTFGFDRARAGVPYWPMLSPGKQVVVLSARGDGGYGPGGPSADANLLEASLRIPLSYIGISDFYSVAVEWDEFGDERVASSLLDAEAEIDALVTRLAADRAIRAA